MPLTLPRFRLPGNSLRTIAQDSFSRADNAATLGNLESGQTWLYGSAGDVGGLTWQVSGGRATCFSNPTDAHAYLDCGVSDLTLQCRILTTSASQLVGFLFRRQDASNYLVIRCGTGTVNNVGILRNLAGARGTVVNGSAPITSGVPATLTLILKGTLVTILVDGISAFAAPQVVTNFSTATLHGIYSAVTTTFVDDFSATVAA